MKILTVVGARPNFMKAAPFIRAIEEHNRNILLGEGGNADSREKIQHILIHTGQHYDNLMSSSFLADLKLPHPDVYLGVGSGSHAEQTGKIMKQFEDVVLRQQPDAVVVVGDVNSTVACALVTAKISFDLADRRPLLAHVEAGLRSFDRTMPEEHNRVVTDHLSDLLFVTEESGVDNLRREGIPSDKVFFVGNTMIDCLVTSCGTAESSPILERLGLRDVSFSNGSPDGIKPYSLLTLHRPANVDIGCKLLDILNGLEELQRVYPVIFPCHPRSRRRIQEFGLEHHFKTDGSIENGRNRSCGIFLIDPLSYLDFLCLMKHAQLVLSDSGGIQEETTYLGIPCVTIRENTERPVTLTCGTNVLAGVTSEGIRQAIDRQINRVSRNDAPEKWDGKAAPRILEVLLNHVARREQALVGALSCI